MTTLSLEQPDFGLQIVDLLRQELYQIQQILFLLVQVVLLILVVCSEELLVSRIKLLVEVHLSLPELSDLSDDSSVLPLVLQ